MGPIVRLTRKLIQALHNTFIRFDGEQFLE